MEIGEGTATYSEPEEPADEVEKITIRFSVFFDGTLNNRTNIDARLVSSSSNEMAKDEQAIAAELKGQMSDEEFQRALRVYKKYKGVGSYENGYTNIAKMERYILDAEGYDKTFHSYIEGPGTDDERKDKILGYAFGTRSTGVTEKVKKGINDIVERVSSSNANKKTVIEKLTIDVFGFSRGAACARNCIHESLHGNNTIKSRLTGAGYTVGQVEVHFAGLYDTVSSHGLSFSNDTRTLKLDAVAHARQTVHLAAADEHRKNFSLTTIDSAGGKGREIYLPGVHSDVGGSYRDGAEEKLVIFSGGEFDIDDAKREYEHFIQSGWYNEDEITLQIDEYPDGLTDVSISVHRQSISNQYARIPLHIMAEFARKNKINLNPNLERVEAISEKLGVAESKLKKYAKNASNSKADDWQTNDEWLRKLRNEYFHFSAHNTIGLTPRYINGQRQRRYYAG